MTVNLFLLLFAGIVLVASIVLVAVVMMFRQYGKGYYQNEMLLQQRIDSVEIKLGHLQNKIMEHHGRISSLEVKDSGS